MRISDEKRISLSSKIADALCEKDGPADSTLREKVFQQTRSVFDRDGRRESEIDALVAKKIASIKRDIRKGSSEWEALTIKFRDEELSKIRVTKKW